MFNKRKVRKLKNRVKELEYKLDNRIVPPKDIRQEILGADYQLFERISKLQKLEYLKILDLAKVAYFIYDKPKAMVGGDSFWIKKTENKLHIALWDAAGHGINGGLTSYYIDKKINEINSSNISFSAADFLNKLNPKIRLLNTDQETYRTDMTFCIIDFDNKSINYSGVIKPIFIDKNGLTELKTDKAYLGDNKNFIDYYQTFENSCMIFLQTDGYQDQFGGQAGRKFGHDSLISMYQEFFDLPITKQTETIEKKLIDWISGSKQKQFEQTDDILIMGLKITTP